MKIGLKTGFLDNTVSIFVKIHYPPHPYLWLGDDAIAKEGRRRMRSSAVRTSARGRLASPLPLFLSLSTNYFPGLAPQPVGETAVRKSRVAYRQNISSTPGLSIDSLGA